MSGILDNELVKKYFGCEVWGCNSETENEPKHRSGIDCRYSTAFHVLRAMQEPIRKGDRLLRWSGNKVTEEVALKDYQGGESPRLFIRLPDQFQEQECDCFCHTVHPGCCRCVPKYQPQREAVEEKIKLILKLHNCPAPPPEFEERLLELVRLCR